MDWFVKLNTIKEKINIIIGISTCLAFIIGVVWRLVEIDHNVIENAVAITQLQSIDQRILDNNISQDIRIQSVDSELRSYQSFFDEVLKDKARSMK